MACSGELPPAQRPRFTVPTTIACLTEDILIHVLLSIRSLPALVRAACTCREFLRLASDPDFRRRFRATHPAPLLGLFFNPPNEVAPAIPSFFPVRRDDADLAKVILSGDFFLTPLYVGPSVPPWWRVVDSRCGHLLLMNWHELRLAVLHPLERKVEGFFDLHELGFLEDLDGGPQDQILEPRLICSDDYPSMFFIFCLFHNERRVRVAVFSSGDDSQAILLPWMEAPGRLNPLDVRPEWLENGMQAGVFIYYFYQNYERVIILDTTERLELYAEEVHPSLHVEDVHHYVLGEGVDSAEGFHLSLPLVIYATGNTIGSKLGGAPGSLAGQWTIDRVRDLNAEVQSLLLDIPMELPQGYGKPVIVALRNGCVYFTTSRIGEHDNVPCWFASLSMETGQVDRLLLRTYDTTFQPYVMPWPRFLLDDQDDDDQDDDDDLNDQKKDNMDKEQQGPASTPKHLSKESETSSSTGKQLSEQPKSSSLEPIQDVLKQKNPWKGSCKFLLSKGIPVDIVCGHRTPLYHASINEQDKTVKILLDHDANLGQLAVELVASHSCREEIEMLFPLTSSIPNVPNCTIDGLISHAKLKKAKPVNERQIKERKAMLQSRADKVLGRKEYDMASKFNGLVIDHEPDAPSDAYKFRMIRPDWAKACCRQAARMILKEHNQAFDAVLDAQKLDPGNDEIERELRKDMELMKISSDEDQK